MTGFDLENPDHAYMFGFLQADGHLYAGTRNRGRISVELSARDSPLPEAFQRDPPLARQHPPPHPGHRLRQRARLGHLDRPRPGVP
ncbi:hypothetical protein [Kitasatospora sp. DSM 101779]|uniref:hypothetical protein n=1 Tax=Kitasatospora sp. DSM 101779 TaxID=2853165 RepID=UPI0021D93A83|nr:hypothetical protein [Kitasatospora sp. DSM 101779]MCU7822530.1 hypothetical protein [Kitasatospora sp. DSM 101779]